jgi:acyl-CoA reductase-like NAD-dependent aldehyde dehydrogenase
MELVREEVFGPVMAVMAFESEEEAISRANDSIYGLGAGVMTNDAKRAHRLAKQLIAGNVWINNWNISPIEVSNHCIILSFS